MLVRHHVGKRLRSYYAQTGDALVGTLQQSPSIQFRSLLGEWHWKRTFGKLYNELPQQWMTPVELFAPYYSYCLAEAIRTKVLESHGGYSSESPPPVVRIVELGGGRGTNARHIVEHLNKEGSSDVSPVRVESYEILEFSESLRKIQQQQQLDARPEGDQKNASTSKTTAKDRPQPSVITSRHCDLIDVAEGRESLFGDTATKANVHTIVLACEVLDNLPHDKIRLLNGQVQQGCIHENNDSPVTEVSESEGDTDESSSLRYWHSETFEPLTDKLLTTVLETGKAYSKILDRPPIRWIPTVACGILEAIAKESKKMKNVSVIWCDFDSLPQPMCAGLTNSRPASNDTSGCEPLITDMHDVDYPCYLSIPEAKPHDTPTDVLFATDFFRLAKYGEAVFRRCSKGPKVRLTVQKQSDMLIDAAPRIVKQTKSWLTGYSPLVSDFANCSVLSIDVSR